MELKYFTRSVDEEGKHLPVGAFKLKAAITKLKGIDNNEFPMIRKLKYIERSHRHRVHRHKAHYLRTGVLRLICYTQSSQTQSSLPQNWSIEIDMLYTEFTDTKLTTSELEY